MSLFIPNQVTTSISMNDFRHRGKIIRYARALDPGDPTGTKPDVYVVCEKHNSYIPAGIYTFNMNDFKEMVNKAFDNCPGCTGEKEWSKSRFPEGAEL